MKRVKRTLTAICAAAVMAGGMSLPASAVVNLSDDEPLAKMLDEMEQDTNSYFRETTPGLYHYLTEDNFHAIQLTRKNYDIYLENGASLPEDAVTQLEQAVFQKRGGGKVTLKEGAPELENGVAGNASLEQLDDGVYRLTLTPYDDIDDSVLAAYLQTIPAFERVTYEAVGYDMANIKDINVDYNYIGSATSPAHLYGAISFDVRTIDDAALTVEDFPEELGVTSVEPVAASVWTTDSSDLVYRMQLDEERYDTLTRGEMIQMLKRIEAMEQVESVDLNCYRNEIAILHPEKYCIGSGSIPYVTRGDCDGNTTIDSFDAYYALLHYATISAGGEATLSGQELSAADVNGDGKVDTFDAYDMLLYYATKSAGLDASWSEILQ